MRVCSFCPLLYSITLGFACVAGFIFPNKRVIQKNSKQPTFIQLENVVLSDLSVCVGLLKQTQGQRVSVCYRCRVQRVLFSVLTSVLKEQAFRLIIV